MPVGCGLQQVSMRSIGRHTVRSSLASVMLSTRSSLVKAVSVFVDVECGCAGCVDSSVFYGDAAALGSAGGDFRACFGFDFFRARAADGDRAGKSSVWAALSVSTFMVCGCTSISGTSRGYVFPRSASVMGFILGVRFLRLFVASLSLSSLVVVTSLIGFSVRKICAAYVAESCRFRR